ncbi:hypothetical protein Tco_1160319 [Tanacetum coccineum]
MAAPVEGNEVARRVVDDLIDFSGQTSLNELIAEMEAFEDPGEVFDTLMRLMDDKSVENAKLMGLNELITQAEEEIEMKEAYNYIVNLGSVDSFFSLKGVNLKFCSTLSHGYECLVDYGAWYVHFEELDAYVTAGSLEKSSEVAESPRLADKMKYVFGCSRGEDESFVGLMRNLFFSLRISLSKKRRLVSELEAVGEVESVVKSLEHMRVIVARDAMTLGELETLLARAQIGVSLKAGFVDDMEVKD